jgi:hypothetical protein
MTMNDELVAYEATELGFYTLSELRAIQRARRASETAQRTKFVSDARVYLSLQTSIYDLPIEGLVKPCGYKFSQFIPGAISEEVVPTKRTRLFRDET